MNTVSLNERMTMTPSFVQADSPIRAVEELFSSHSFRHLPVLMGKQVVGLISHRDVELAYSLADSIGGVEQLTAADICQPDPFTVDVSTPFAEVVHLMGERKSGAAIVTSEGHLVGILTTTDICRICAELLGY